MPTHTLLKDGNILRHGHGNANAPDPEKEQWHEAHVFHRSDPNAHTREASWTSPNWSRNNWDVSASYKEELIEKAQRLHDQAYYRSMGRYPGTATPYITPAITQPDSDDDDIETDFDDGDGDDDMPVVDTDIDTSGLVGKINQAAQLAVMAAKAAGAASDLTKQVQSETATVKRDFEMHRRAAADRANAIDERIDVVKSGVSLVDERVKALESAAANRIEIVIRDDSDNVLKRVTGVQHKKFPLLVRFATALAPERRNIWMQGPAGAGKTHSWEELAKLLGLTFEYIGAIDSPYKLSGHHNANGIYLPTAFRRAYENGGVILLDEVDAGDPRALLEINAALANKRAAFPDGMVDRHDNCIIGCAANTWGYGGDAAYVGRNRIDVAFLTRFVKMNWDYDEDLERMISGEPGEWVDVVHTVRRAVFTKGAQGIVISPRASQFGCELLRAGFSNEEVVEATLGDFRKNSMWSELGKAAEDFAKKVRPTVSLPTTPAAASSDDRNDDDVTVNMSNVRLFNTRTPVVAR